MKSNLKSEGYKSQFADLFLSYSSESNNPSQPWKKEHQGAASKNTQQSRVTQQYIWEDEMQNADQPPKLIYVEDDNVAASQMPPLNSSHRQTESKPSKQLQPDFSAQQTRFIARCTEELAASKLKQEQLSQQIQKYKLLEHKIKEYETLVDNVTERNRQLELRISRMNENTKQLEGKLRKQQEEFKKQQVTATMMHREAAQVELGQNSKSVHKEVFVALEGYLKKLIGEFVQDIKMERMTKKLESKIEAFLETLLQINSQTIANNKQNRNAQIAFQPSRIITEALKTASKPRPEDQSRVRAVSPYSHSPAARSVIARAASPTPAQKFGLIRHSIQPSQPGDMSSILNMTTLDKNQSRFRELDDRGRSKSQRRRRIFQ